jgi:hypothetical protein
MNRLTLIALACSLTLAAPANATEYGKPAGPHIVKVPRTAPPHLTEDWRTSFWERVNNS